MRSGVPWKPLNATKENLLVVLRAMKGGFPVHKVRIPLDVKFESRSGEALTCTATKGILVHLRVVMQFQALFGALQWVATNSN